MGGLANRQGAAMHKSPSQPLNAFLDGIVAALPRGYRNAYYCIRVCIRPIHLGICLPCPALYTLQRCVCSSSKTALNTTPASPTIVSYPAHGQQGKRKQTRVDIPHMPCPLRTFVASPKGGWACRGPPCPRRSPPPPSPRSAAGCTGCSPGGSAPPSPARRSRACRKSGKKRGGQASRTVFFCSSFSRQEPVGLSQPSSMYVQCTACSRNAFWLGVFTSCRNRAVVTLEKGHHPTAAALATA